MNVDSTYLNTISLFSGVGMLDEGFHAGLEYLGIRSRTVMFAEREDYPVAVLAARMEEGSIPPAPIWFGDLCELDAGQFRGVVDCVVAGFPCQDLSVAGKRAGLDGKRSGLFFEVTRIARDSGARLILLENVAGIASATATVMDEAEELEERAAARVLGELADLGWDAEWLTLSASDVGASHGRARWFCIAWRMDDAMRPKWWAGGIGGSGCRQGDDGEREAHGRAGISGAAHLGNPGLQHQHLQQREDVAEHPGAGQPVGHAESERNGQGSLPVGIWQAVAVITGGSCELAHSERNGRHQGGPESGRDCGTASCAQGKDGRRCAEDCHGIECVCGCVADTSKPGLQGRELGRACNRNRGGQETHGPTSQLCGLFAPGPSDPRWSDIIAREPWRSPALSIEGQLDAAAAFAEAQSVLRGVSDGVETGLDFDNRAQRLKCIGNGVVPAQCAAAVVVLVRRAGIA